MYLPNTPVFTGISLYLPEYTRIYRNTPVFTGIHLYLPEYTCIYRNTPLKQGVTDTTLMLSPKQQSG
jgi:hypothetical protein